MARPKRKMLALFPELLESTADLNDEQFGRLMRSAFTYRFAGEPYNGDDIAVKIAFRFVASQIDRYEEQCKTNSNNAKGGNGDIDSSKHSETGRKDTEQCEMEPNTPHSHTHNHTHNPNRECEGEKPPEVTRFVKPSLSEIRLFCQANNLNIDPERFFDFYESNGWMVGKNHMADWRATVRNWARKEDINGRTEQHNNRTEKAWDESIGNVI